MKLKTRTKVIYSIKLNTKAMSMSRIKDFLITSKIGWLPIKKLSKIKKLLQLYLFNLCLMCSYSQLIKMVLSS